MSFTVVEYYGKQNNSRCGYCKETKSSHSHGMHAYVMTPQDYQDLIDRGWRRSGLYCYKPNNQITCCPSYTIKCDSQKFELSKSHKKILRKMNKFLTNGIKDKSNDNCTSKQNKEKDEQKMNKDDDDDNNDDGCGDAGGGASGGSTSTFASIKEEPDVPNITPRNINLNEIQKGEPAEYRENQQINEKADSNIPSSSSLLAELSLSISSSQKAIKKGIGPDDTKPICKKAKQIRLERKKMKLQAKGLSFEEYNKIKEKLTTANQDHHSNKQHEKTLSEYINEIPENGCHKLKIKLVDVNSMEFDSTLNQTYGLYMKYQRIIHNDPPDDVKEYLCFLQVSPLKNKVAPEGPSQGYGSFHQQYWLDDHLIAVGVIDILPSCVSSVYFFYDPDYSFLSLGTYGSLREIDFTQQLSEQVPTLKYYYMGFYIHSCPKMRYKGKLTPSYLLCPEVYSWHLLTDEIKSKLEQNKYQRFNNDLNAKDENEFIEENDLNSVLILVGGTTYVTYEQYRNVIGEIDETDNILEYGRLVGKKCAHRMLYVH